MKVYGINEIKENVELYGRTYLDQKREVLYFNWSLSGFETEFEGSYLEADLVSLPDSRPEQIPSANPMEPETVMVPDWAWIQVVLDGKKEPWQKILLDQESKKVILFASEKTEHHVIRVVKLTENFRTAVGIRRIVTDGKIGRSKTKETSTIEFIGDSITCGFGNLATDGNRMFYTEDEDAWLTHGAIAARELGWKPSLISISGFAMTKYEGYPFPHGVEELYPYTDLVTQERLGGQEPFEVWDFEEHPTDYIVLNIGTNDSTFVKMAEDPWAAEQIYEDHYLEFLKMLRKYNGPKTKIICAMGSIDYYLYDRILSAVERLKKETGDRFIYTMKYTKMLSMGLDVGACFHPSRSKQEKMAQELVRFIRERVIPERKV